MLWLLFDLSSEVFSPERNFLKDTQHAVPVYNYVVLSLLFATSFNYNKQRLVCGLYISLSEGFMLR